MNPGHRRKKYRKVIDIWYFATHQNFHDKEIVAFEIVMSRDADMQEEPGIATPRPRVRFEARVKAKESSPQFSKSDVEIEDDDINKLRSKTQQAFEELTAKDWKKIILVSIKGDEGSFRTNLELEFAWLVCERAGDLYRRSDDGWTTRNPSELCGGSDHRELPWTQEAEDSLRAIEGKLKDLAVALDRLVQDPVKLVQVTGNFPALLSGGIAP